ncbi:hypothetical protein [Achromobacter piechaudii]|uniref:Bacterial toxin YdaT domain-containing protein n=1 Tax=Achromobacter piechaudii TaxID=72556 RepID=A0A6S7ELH0_9BURK|nr:hypothetical protein [Achromobacter piechaudii]CAB3916112.1 hypothetical protein LMG1861_05091 [Achromobacter piechaudii]
MRHESHKTLLAVLRDHTSAWRKSLDWSRETIVREHEARNGPAVTGIRFEPPTHDAFSRMKANADRMSRWLDDESKGSNLLPANFLPSVLAAMPHDRRRHCIDDVLRPLGLAVRSLELEERSSVDVTQVTKLMRDQTEASAAAVALLDGDVTLAELTHAHRELSESIVAARSVRAIIEAQMMVTDIPACFPKAELT